MAEQDRNSRARDLVNRAKIQQDAYDKAGYAQSRREALGLVNAELADNERRKRELGVPAGSAARNAMRNVRSAKDRSMAAADEASRILSGGGQRSDRWQD